MSTLLLLPFIIAQVHTLRYPFIRLGESGPALSNHSYVNLSRVEDGYRTSLQCHTDLVTCCRTLVGPDRGDWYFPNGSVLKNARFGGSIFRNLQNQRIDLRRRYSNHDANGIYKCTIETNAVNNETGREIFYVGLYASGGKARKAFLNKIKVNMLMEFYLKPITFPNCCDLV